MTASHNPPQDNGLKILNETGFFVKKSTEIDLLNFVKSSNLSESFKNLKKSSNLGKVIIG